MHSSRTHHATVLDTIALKYGPENANARAVSIRTCFPPEENEAFARVFNATQNYRRRKSTPTRIGRFRMSHDRQYVRSALVSLAEEKSNQYVKTAFFFLHQLPLFLQNCAFIGIRLAAMLGRNLSRTNSLTIGIFNMEMQT